MGPPSREARQRCHRWLHRPQNNQHFSTLLFFWAVSDSHPFPSFFFDCWHQLRRVQHNSKPLTKGNCVAGRCYEMTHFALAFEDGPLRPGVERSSIKSLCILAPRSIEKQAVDLGSISTEPLFTRRAVKWKDGSLRHFRETFCSQAAEHQQDEAGSESIRAANIPFIHL